MKIHFLRNCTPNALHCLNHVHVVYFSQLSQCWIQASVINVKYTCLT